MKTFICTDHDGVWPVGVASVIFANDEAEARRLLDEALVASHLQPSSQEPYSLQCVESSSPKAIILNDGNY